MKKSVLFVCIGNSCRSIMAEALTRHYWRDSLNAYSAGTYPLGYMTAFTLQVLTERGVPTDGLYSKGFSSIPFGKILLVVSLSGETLHGLLPRSYSGAVIPRYVHDPYGEGLSVFRSTLTTIEEVVRTELPRWLQLSSLSSPD